MKRKAQIGSISHGTLRTEDLLSAFADELEWLTGPNDLSKEAQEINPESEEASELVNDLIDALQELAPPYCYFGAHEGDGADFGFWFFWDAINELPRVADPADVEGLGEDCVFVNDHGNITIYGADGAVIWDCV